MKVDGKFFKSATSSLWLLIILFQCCFKVESRQVKPIQCKDDSGNSVDWIYAYKLPKLKTAEEPYLNSGTGYLYFSSKDNKWQLSQKSLNYSTSFLGYTLSPLYDERKVNTLMYLAYNDDPPNAEVTTSYAHAKGVLATDFATGFWLIHSSPNFPDLPNDESFPSYTFPLTASKYGQSFLCISLLITEMEDIGELLQMMRPKVYKAQIPAKFRNKFPDLVGAAEGKYTKHGPWILEKKLQTIQGTTFTSFSKSKNFGKDIYSDYVVTELKTPLDVETWMNGPNPLKSDCENSLTTLNIREISFKIDEETFEFPSSRDHSKWAVSGESSKPWICVGDINRMASQFKRGGGTVCVLNSNVWKAYYKGIKEIDACPLKNTTKKNQNDGQSINSKNDVVKSTTKQETLEGDENKQDNDIYGENDTIQKPEKETNEITTQPTQPKSTGVTKKTRRKRRRRKQTLGSDENEQNRDNSDLNNTTQKPEKEANEITIQPTQPKSTEVASNVQTRGRRTRKQKLGSDENEQGDDNSGQNDIIPKPEEEETTEVIVQQILKDLTITTQQPKSLKQSTSKKAPSSKGKKRSTKRKPCRRPSRRRSTRRRRSKRRSVKLSYSNEIDDDEDEDDDNDVDDDDPNDVDFDLNLFQ